MSTIARINTSISDHNMAANTVALFVLACVSVFSAAATIHNGNVVKSSYNSLLRSIPAEQVNTAVSQSKTAQPTAAITLKDDSGNAIQNQPSDSVLQLQPATNQISNKTGTIYFQPNAYGVTLSGVNSQNAQGSL